MPDNRGQLVIDFSPAARKTHPVTSHIAGQKVPEFGTAHCARILTALRENNGSTTKELSLILQNILTYPQIQRRMHDLANNGYIVRNDKITRDGCCTWWIK